MLRRSIIAITVPLLLVAGMLAATPTAQAAPQYDNSIGVVKVPNQVRKGRCGSYRLRWNFNPPTEDWTVTADIKAPKGFSVVSQFWDSNSPNNLGRTEGRLRIRICGSSIKPGRYKILMKMQYDRSVTEEVTVYRAPTYFRLLKRR